MKNVFGLLVSFCTFLPVLSAQEYSHVTYTITDGLPDHVVVSVYEDQLGYLWVATNNGISRFDGSSFTNYSLRDGLPSANCIGFYQDRDGRLWVSTRKGIAEFRKDSLIRYPLTAEREIRYVQKFIEDDSNHLVAITDAGLIWFDQDQWKPYPEIPGLQGDTIFGWIQTSTADYFAVNGNKIYRISDAGKGETIWHRHAAQPTVKTLQQFADTVYFTTFDSVYRIDDHKITPLYADLVKGKTIRSMWRDHASSFWITSDEDGITHYMTNDPGTRQERVPVPYHFIASIIGDARGFKWSSTGLGLIQFTPKPYRTIHIRETLPEDHIRHLIALPHNEFLLALGYGRLLHISVDPSAIAGYHTLHEIRFDTEDDFTDNYAFDSDSSLWISTRFGKLFRYSRGKMIEKNQLIPPTLPKIVFDVDIHPVTHQMFVATKEILLVGTGTSLDTLKDRNKQFIRDPSQIVINDAGAVFIQTFSHGTYIYTPGHKAEFVHLPEMTSVSNRSVDDHGNPMLSEDGRSLFRLLVAENGSIVRDVILSDHPAMEFHFSDIIMDADQSLWGVSPQGVIHLTRTLSGVWSMETINAFDDQPNLYRHFTRLAESEREVWLSLKRDLISFDKTQTASSKFQPRVAIETVLLNNTRTAWEKYADSLYSYFQIPHHPVMRHDENTLTFHYNAPDLLYHSSIEYAYRLLPEDTTWSHASTNRSVSFNKLRPEEYEFQVKCVSAAGSWSETISFPFTIRKAFWDQAWFHLLILAIAVAIIAVLFRFRVKQERKKGEIRNQLLELEMRAFRAQMNPHFIYNALNSIQSLVATNQTAKAGRYISMFARLLRQVMEFSQKGVVTLSRELETVRLYLELEQLRMDVPVVYTENMDPEIIPESTFIPPLLLQPFVENALWHGLSKKVGEKRLEIAMTYTEQYLLVTITDNGIGRKKSEELKSASPEHTSMALAVTAQRIIDFNRDQDTGALKIIDLMDPNGQPAGTQVRFQIRQNTEPGKMHR